MPTRTFVAVFVAAVGVAVAQDSAKTWDFQGDEIDEAPAGFSFARTGEGRPGKWIVRADPSAPAVEARGDRFVVSFDGKQVIDARDGTFRDAGKVGLWTKADSVTEFDALSVKPLQ